LLKIVILVFLSLFFTLDAHAFWFFHRPVSDQQSLLESNILSDTAGLNPHVLSLALAAYHKLHQAGYDTQQILTIVDYSRPSVERRFWVIDLKNLRVHFQTLVANGKNSNPYFSDKPSSHTSSIGVYLTSETYMGKHGYSLRLKGLEPGFNDKAQSRDIVVHAANYVSETFARIHGRLGRSWGCFALNPQVSHGIIDDIKGGTVLFAYYPDPQWLNHSTFLT
jgi:hypothetical protein